MFGSSRLDSRVINKNIGFDNKSVEPVKKDTQTTAKAEIYLPIQHAKLTEETNSKADIKIEDSTPRVDRPQPL